MYQNVHETTTLASGLMPLGSCRPSSRRRPDVKGVGWRGQNSGATFALTGLMEKTRPYLSQTRQQLEY